METYVNRSHGSNLGSDYEATHTKNSHGSTRAARVGVSLLAFIFSFSPALAAPDYDALYPFNVSICAVTQKKKINSNTSEQPWGHLTMYIKGACRDRNAAYPRLRECQTGEIDGAIISVNSLFKNVNWIAIEGRDLAFNGELQPGQTLDQAHYDRITENAIKDGVFKGTLIHDSRYDGSEPLDLFVAHHSVDIDFALSFGRDNYCARLPITQPMLREMINNLNARNEGYFTGKTGIYTWDAIKDNCAHLIHNVLAALGVWKPKETNRSLPVQAFNLAIPANEVLEIMEFGQGKKLPNPASLFKTTHLRDALLKWNWLPFRHGILNETTYLHQPNNLYKGDLSIFILDPPFAGKTTQFYEYAANPKYRDMLENLRRYNRLYAEALADMDEQGVDGYLPLLKPEVENFTAQVSRFKQFFAQYRAYLQAQLDETSRALATSVP
jgi:hypothetical protein